MNIIGNHHITITKNDLPRSITIDINEDFQAIYSPEFKVLHVIDIDSDIVFTSRKNVRDLDHAREIIESL